MIEDETIRRAPRDWANQKQAELLDAAGGSPLVADTWLGVASMLERWPNPDLDPTHKITEAEFDAALEHARSL